MEKRSRGAAPAQACVEVTAVLSETTIAAGRLAAWRSGETIEIVPDRGADPAAADGMAADRIAAGASGMMVLLKAAGQTFARARVEQIEDRLVATIIEISDAGEFRDEWRFAAKAVTPAG